MGGIIWFVLLLMSLFAKDQTTTRFLWVLAGLYFIAWAIESKK